MEQSPFLSTGEKTEGVSGGVNSLARSRSIIASYPTIDFRADGINSHSGTCFLVIGTVMIQFTHYHQQYNSKNTRMNRRKLDGCFHLWEFIFGKQLDVGIYFRREGPLRNIRK